MYDFKLLLTGLALILAFLTTILLRKRLRKADKTTDLETEKEMEQKKQQEREDHCDALYKMALKKELGNIGIIGPRFDRVSTSVTNTFTDLRISQSLHCLDDLQQKQQLMQKGIREEMVLSPDKVLDHAFPDYQLLLVIGDPGSGKTTLLKHYALSCLNSEGYFPGNETVLPLYFPLRDIQFKDDGTPIDLAENLAVWAASRHIYQLTADVFRHWLENRRTLVLLDGLDEIGDTGNRRQVCRWVERIRGLNNASFILTSRPTGYRKLDNLELDCDHLRGDIMDFSHDQQRCFLHKWFRAAAISELGDEPSPEERDRAEKEASDRADAVIVFLEKKENAGIRELVRVPVLLQIMAITWKKGEYIPGTRSDLYDLSLDYLLEYRDARRNLSPALTARQARLVLAPVALWMQENQRDDSAPREEIHRQMQEVLKTLDSRPEAGLFCKNLRDRAGVIAAYGEEKYIFRHKSFMEYLAALHLKKECLRNKVRIDQVAGYFGDSWWDETLRFFFSICDDEIFDCFMAALFRSENSKTLKDNQQTLLQELVKEAPQKKVDALAKALESGKLNQKQERYILDSLKTIASHEAWDAVQEFVKNSPSDNPNKKYAAEAIFDRKGVSLVESFKEDFKALLTADNGFFHNPFEGGVEYIKIPAGDLYYKEEKKRVSVPEMYFCKYPVINKRYRSFISYLSGDHEYMDRLPLRTFGETLLEFAKGIKGYEEYLGTDVSTWN
ncbi:MAG: NACHT domain-containing protein, partial [bacterium]|nr:NACHT domain-containing protein [bacterium]